MKHTQIRIHLKEWFDEVAERTPDQAHTELVTFLIENSYRSLEIEIADSLKAFTGIPVNQDEIKSFLEAKGTKKEKERTPNVFVTCFRKEESFLFIDIEREGPFFSDDGRTFIVSSERDYEAEIDIFSINKQSLQSAKDAITEDVMKCFGLTQSKEALLASTSTEPFAKVLRDRLTVRDPLNEELFQKLRDEREREILREIKRRGSILERDLHELRIPNIQPDRIKKTLDYLSGEEYRLVERKYAILCNETQEIIFTLPTKESIEGAHGLECPKCSKQISEETIMPYYRTTEELKKLLDGSRWMPLLVRDVLIAAGVPSKDVFTEVKNGEDEIDVLVFYRGRIFVMELKNRPVNLNDAYKLSAKTSRLESIAVRNDQGSEEISEGIIWDPNRMSYGITTQRALNYKIEKGTFICFVITTHDIAKDARDLLEETRDNVRIIESCDNELEASITKLIDKINSDELQRRLYTLTSADVNDSVSRLAAFQIRYALAKCIEPVS